MDAVAKQAGAKDQSALKLPVLLLSREALGGDQLDRGAGQAAVAALRFPVAIDHLLRRDIDEALAGFGPSALDRARGRECPTRSARPLVFDFGDPLLRAGTVVNVGI